MPKEETNRMRAQAVGAYGEKAVEAELLRHGWIASNVNASIKNAVDFDIFALKKNRSVQLRVKTCGPNIDAFQFGGFQPAQDIGTDEISEGEFMILVRMGVTRQDDHFYIIPTRIIRETLSAYRKAYLGQAKRDGGARKDVGHWTLFLKELRSGEDRINFGLARKWETYRDNWGVLEGGMR